MDSMPKRPRSAGRWLAAVLLATTTAAGGFADDLQDGIALFREGKYAEAEAPARAALDANPTHEAAVAALGEALVGQKKYDAAIEGLTAAIGKKDDLAYAYFWRGQAYDKKNQAARMVADYQTFLRLAPKSPEAASVQAVLSALR